jgi:hypothetical protein
MKNPDLRSTGENHNYRLAPFAAPKKLFEILFEPTDAVPIKNQGGVFNASRRGTLIIEGQDRLN